MKISPQIDGSLVVSEFPSIFLFFSIGVLAEALWLMLDPTPPRNAGLATFILILFGVLLLLNAERSLFIFDSAQQMLHWKRTRLLKRSSGRLPFRQIEKVLLETDYNSGGRYRGSLHRLALVTQQGRIPLTHAFSGNRARVEEVRSKIQQVLESQPFEDYAQAG